MEFDGHGPFRHCPDNRIYAAGQRITGPSSKRRSLHVVTECFDHVWLCIGILADRRRGSRWLQFYAAHRGNEQPRDPSTRSAQGNGGSLSGNSESRQ